MAFFNLYPTINYDITGTKPTNYQNITNLLFRFGFLQDILDNISAYYEYNITESDTPEILAEKAYGDATAYWIILLANRIHDPQYDWPLKYEPFNNYIISKYGSIANSQVGIHHYEKVIRREEVASGVISENRYVIDYNTKTNGLITLSGVNGTFSAGEAVYQGNTLVDSTFTANVISWMPTNNSLQLANTIGKIVRYEMITGDSSSANGNVVTIDFPGVPYDYYLSLDEEQSVVTLNVFGKTVIETTFREAVTYFDYENNLNEERRRIKVIKKDYYPQIMREFRNLVRFQEPFIRNL